MKVKIMHDKAPIPVSAEGGYPHVYKIIIVEDDEGLNRLIQKTLNREGFQTESALTGDEARKKISGKPGELILLDYQLPDMTGIQLIQELLEKYGPIPFVMMTGHGNEKIAVEMLKSGAMDYIVKEGDFIEILPEKVKRACAELHGKQKLGQALAESDRLMAAVEQAGEMIVITDVAGLIRYANPAFERVTGYTRNEIIGKNPRILQSGKQTPGFYQELWQTITSGRTWQGRMVNKRKDGKFFTEEATISPVLDPAGSIVNYVAVKHDITEHLRLTNDLHQAQKMESVGRLAGGVAHDYNNALSVILGYTEMAMDRTAPADPLYADLQEIRKAAESSADLTRQLLAFARKQSIAPKVFDLNEAVEGMLKILRRLIGEDIDLAWLPGANLCPVQMDPSQLDQILANLCINARDAIGDVGKITIETETVTFDEAYCADHPEFFPGDFVLLALSDDGCGMDKETSEKIFEPFFTTKELGKGTGLGLATVYGIVKQNNGFITVYSEIGQGTTFKIYLSRHKGMAGRVMEDNPPDPAPSGHETILLVEDEPAILKMSKMILERLGYRVLAAGSPADAIRLAEAHTAEIHLLITDVVMPGMNGRDLADRLSARCPALKHLFMSGYTANVIIHRGVLDEGVFFIQKPFSVKELAVKVRKAIESK